MGARRRRLRPRGDGGREAWLPRRDGSVGGEVEEREPVPGEVVDTTGAGDALAAGFIVGGIDLGVEAAARCVAQMGAVP